MRIYITGSKGVIGSALWDHHKHLGHTVSGCDISNAYRNEHHDHLDIRDFDKLRMAIEAFKPDRVYHCAAMLGVQNTEKHPAVCVDINERGTENVVDICAYLEVPHLVFLSSSEVYGNGYPGTPFTERSPLLGSNVYAVGKAASEFYVLSRSDKTKTTICRMFNCYGPHQVRQFFIPKVLELAKTHQDILLYGSADNKRSYLCSADAAIHICNVADSAPDGEIVNVGSAHTYTLGQVAGLAVSRTKSVSAIRTITEGYPDRSVSRDVPNRLADLTLLRQYSTSGAKDIGLRVGMMIMLSFWGSTKPDWDYERSVFND